MRPWNAIFASLILFGLVSAQGKSTCPILGKQWPAPRNLSHEPLIQAAAKNLTSKIDNLVKSNSEGWNATSFSITLFSTSEESFAYEYHRTDPIILHGAAGVRNVTADSAYRIGSISKLLTVYLFLIQLGGHHLHTPITHFVPELLVHANASLDDIDVICPKWQEITLADLASYLSGLPDDLAYDLAIPVSDNQPLLNATPAILPPLPRYKVPSCGFDDGLNFVACSDDELIRNVRQLQPIFATAYTPIYSNVGYALLGIALARATNKTMAQIFDDQLVRHLNLSAAKYDAPFASCKGVIPVNESSAGWQSQYSAYGAAASNFASSQDMAKIGRSMLRSSLLSPVVTKRWLKPTSFIEDFAQGVGLAWEIYRAKVDKHSVDIYSKGGDIGAYHSTFAIIPDYNVGFSIMTAVDPHTGYQVKIDGTDIVASTLLPAVAQVAKQQATRNFATRYVTRDGTNSSLALTTDNLPGLKLESWIVNGTDMFLTLFANSDGSKQGDVRLLPNELYPESSGKVGFTGTFLTFTTPAGHVANGNLSDFYGVTCQDYAGQSRVLYGGVDITQLVFDVDAQGKAVAFHHLALRKTFYRAE